MPEQFSSKEGLPEETVCDGWYYRQPFNTFLSFSFLLRQIGNQVLRCFISIESSYGKLQ